MMNCWRCMTMLVIGLVSCAMSALPVWAQAAMEAPAMAPGAMAPGAMAPPPSPFGAAAVGGLPAAPGAPVAMVGDAPTIYFWDASGAPAVGKPNPWGNGVAKTTQEVDYEGAQALEVTTRNLHEGVRFDLNPPVDVMPYRANGYIRLRVHFKSVGPPMMPGMGEGMPGMGSEGSSSGMPGMGDGRMPWLRGRGGRPGMGSGDSSSSGSSGGGQRRPFMRPQELQRSAAQFRPEPGGQLPPLGEGGFPGMPGMPGMEGMEGMPMMPMGPPPQRTEITRLQLTLLLERGVMAGFIDIPDLDKVEPDDNGWRVLFAALKDMRSSPEASGALQRVILTSDKEDTFYVAQAALTVETGKMTVSIRRPGEQIGTQLAEITVKPGPLTLVADVEAGTSDPIIEWNFDADNVGNLPPPAGAVPPAGMPGMEGGEMMPGMTPGMTPGMERMRPGMEGMRPGMEGAPVEAAPPGPRVDARGLVAKFDYPNEEQNYRVEVTVRDRMNKKATVSASVLVKVRG